MDIHSVSEREELIGEALLKNSGARINFICDQVTYVGIIDQVFPECGRFNLRHSKIIDSGGQDHYTGYLRFKFCEITSFKVLETAEIVNRYPKNEYLLNILRNNRPPDSKTIFNALFDNKFSDDEDGENDKSHEEKPKKFVLDVPNHLESILPKDFLIIESVSEIFFTAVNCICKQSLIGVSFHGHNVSRFGKLSWICVSTDICSYLFDIEQLGEKAFQKGLKKILESKSVKKVIYDCRLPSDCLARQYNVQLNNVFDIKIADFYLSMQHYNEKIKFISYRSLDSCLRIYLQVPQEYLFERETYSNGSLETFFSKRPITDEYLYDMLRNVIYLKLVYEKLSREILEPFYRTVRCYKNVSDICQGVYNLIHDDLFKPEVVPAPLIMEGIQTARFQKPQKIQNLICKFIDPQTGKVIEPSNSSTLQNIKNLKLNKPRGTLNNKKIHLFKDVSHTTNYHSETFDEYVQKPSLKHLDEVYHNLVYKRQQSRNLGNISSKNEGYFSYSSNNNLSSPGDKNKAKSSCYGKEDSDKCDLWSKIREDFKKEKAALDNDEGRNIIFIPG